MKALIVIAMLIALTATQTTVTPKTQACVCTNLLNQADCVALSGCAWTAANTTNSTNTTATPTTSGTCANSTTTTPVVTVAPTFCGSVANASTACAGTLGCAYLNSTCQIFTGCSAYVQTTNAACQAISTQCTTDGTRCVLPGACSTYTTQALCTGNLATSGARQCKWTAGTGTTGTCGDMICTDAPATYSTLAQCQGWISTCFSTGKGCVASLGLCSSYTIAAGCTGMIGSDGACTASTGAGATACRPFACTDAPATAATNAACNTFLSGCVTTGKGCVSTPQACNSYAQTLGCTGLIGSDGACTTDTTAGALNCRATACTDAPASTTTDAACNTFKTGCQTTGSGCVTARGACSSYQGTTTTCTSFVGTDGNCKGTGTTVGACAAKLCTDAPTTLNSDAACNTFQQNCVTTGAGCVTSLGTCSTYQGTATTCTQYKGSDGNCTAPASQTSAAACVAKVCTDGVFTNNQACQTFSYKCVTDGTRCIEPGTCETIGTALTCQGSSTCNSGSLCLDRSSCVNYLTQSQCLLNQQQYVSSGTTYLRACTWSSSTCTNKLCTDLASTLTLDQDCRTALAGCVSKGAGCVDISAPCSAYQGTNLTCLNFKGQNGTKVCTQLQTQTTAATCIDRTCDNAITANGSKSSYASLSECQTYLSTCFWNGSTGCTSGGCSTYSGLQTFCGTITANGVPCWSTVTSGGIAACVDKNCGHAPSTLTTDPQCTTFLAGCVSNGAGCVKASSTACTAYSGDLSKCSGFNENTNQQCSKTANFCKAKLCSDTIAQTNANTCTTYLSTCVYIGTACTAKKTNCTDYTPAVGSEATQCAAVTTSSGGSCGFKSGTLTCVDKACDNTPAQTNSSTCTAYLSSTCVYIGTACTAKKTNCTDYTPAVGSEATQCAAVTTSSGGSCGFKSGTLTCVDKACDNTPAQTNSSICTSYLSTCVFMGGACIAKATACTDYTPTAGSEANQCAAATNSNGVACGYSAGAKCAAKDCTDAAAQTNSGVCTAYSNTCAFMGTACKAKEAACTGYTPTVGSEAAQCAAATTFSGGSCGSITGTATCVAKACTNTAAQANASTCTSYLGTSCVFINSACVAKDACTTYVVTTANGAAQCPTVTNGSGVGCIYSSATNCSERACTDTIASPNVANCAAYLSTCQFNGSICVAVLACDQYNVVGSTDTDKTANCNRLTGSDGKCTYVTGDKCQKADVCTSYLLTTFDACVLRRNASGAFCGSSDSVKCLERLCSQTLSETTCNDTWLAGCIVDSSTSCASKACNLAATTLTTNDACKAYRQGCVTNGAGCVESSALCAAYQGTQTTCQAFTGGTDGLCNNDVGAPSNKACIKRLCDANTTATSNAACTTWRSTCVWTGTTGCKDPTNCSGFNGTIDTCPTFTGIDGPCSGTGSTSAACVSNSTICNQAPATYSTHTQCQSWHTSCITNGFGCISSSSVKCNMIVSPTVCPLYKTTLSLGCDVASECLTKPTTCGGFTTAFQCNNVPISGSTTVTCAWSTVTGTGTCVSLTCALLPVTLTTDSACSTAIQTCTTNGAGCVTKAACSTYNKLACGPAATTDTQKLCIWANSVCRPIVCSDNTTATSDAACNTYLTNCRTTGLGCSNSLTCSSFTSAAFCLKDQSNNPCLWYRGACINYTKCTDVAAATHTLCQLVSPLCTTNGTTCIAITGCSVTTLQTSCVLGTDGNCGWLPAAGTATAQCALYTSCTAAQGTTTAQCLIWGSTCVSNGTSCIAKATCSSYTTQVGCGNAGTDGTCFYVAPTGTATTGTCRLQLCTDATAATATSISTHTGCVGFTATTSCTTSGTGCISQSTCGSYTVQAGCVQGTDGVCFWATTTTTATATTPATTSSVCRLKQCSDVLLTSSSSCATAITGVKCVSNGVSCIAQSTCSSYTAREACLGGGSDGQCAFTPGTNTTTPNVGTCAIFTSCGSANSDSVTCGSRTDACFFNSTTTNGTTTSSCSSHTCATKALGSTCQAIPSFDLSTYSICVLTGTTCAAGNPSAFNAASCYGNSVRTYTWNPTTSACQSCQTQTQTNSTNNTNNTNNTYGYLISLLIAVTLMF